MQAEGSEMSITKHTTAKDITCTKLHPILTCLLPSSQQEGGQGSSSWEACCGTSWSLCSLSA